MSARRSSRSWSPCASSPAAAGSAAESKRESNAPTESKPLGWAVLALVPAQIVLGSWLRHYGTWPALAAHAVLAAVVWGCCLFLAFMVEQHKASWASLVPSARALGLLATLQVALGIGAFIVVVAV